MLTSDFDIQSRCFDLGFENSDGSWGMMARQMGAHQDSSEESPQNYSQLRALFDSATIGKKIEAIHQKSTLLETRLPGHSLKMRASIILTRDEARLQIKKAKEASEELRGRLWPCQSVSKNGVWAYTTPEDRGQGAEGRGKLCYLAPVSSGGCKTYLKKAQIGSSSSSGQSWGLLVTEHENQMNRLACKRAQKESELWKELENHPSTELSEALEFPLAAYHQNGYYSYYVRHMNGGDLFNWRTKNMGVGTPQDVRRIEEGIFKALAGYHRTGRLHGDIKPENILIHEEEVNGVLQVGKVKLTDIAFSKKIPEGKEIPFSKGTVGYVAQEVLTCHQAVIKSDIFSAGVTLLYLHYGASFYDKRIRNQIVFSSESELASIYCQIAGKEHSSLNSHDQFILSLLKLKAEERPTAEEALATLKTLPLCP